MVRKRELHYIGEKQEKIKSTYVLPRSVNRTCRWPACSALLREQPPPPASLEEPCPTRLEHAATPCMQVDETSTSPVRSSAGLRVCVRTSSSPSTHPDIFSPAPSPRYFQRWSSPGDLATGQPGRIGLAVRGCLPRPPLLARRQSALDHSARMQWILAPALSAVSFARGSLQHNTLLHDPC